MKKRGRRCMEMSENGLRSSVEIWRTGPQAKARAGAEYCRRTALLGGSTSPVETVKVDEKELSDRPGWPVAKRGNWKPGARRFHSLSGLRVCNLTHSSWLHVWTFASGFAAPNLDLPFKSCIASNMGVELGLLFQLRLLKKKEPGAR